MEATIFEGDFITGKRTKLEDFRGTRGDLLSRLRKLQAGWCEAERPRITEEENEIVAESHCDFYHVAVCA